MKKITYSDYTSQEEIKEICSKEKVIFDFNLWDIPATMHRNIKTCAELGAYAVTIANHPLNREGIAAAQEAGEEFGIQIVLGARQEQ